jgi:hypothetical protein
VHNFFIFTNLRPFKKHIESSLAFSLARQQKYFVPFAHRYKQVSLAKADGVIAKEEIDAVTQFMNAIRLSSKDKETAINAFRKASSSEQSILYNKVQYQNDDKPDKRTNSSINPITKNGSQKNHFL